MSMLLRFAEGPWTIVAERRGSAWDVYAQHEQAPVRVPAKTNLCRDAAQEMDRLQALLGAVDWTS